MCDVYEVKVEEPVAYLARFVGAKYAASLDRVRSYVELAGARDAKVNRIVWEALARTGAEEKAYVYAYCRLRGLRSALILAGPGGGVVAFGLLEDRLREVASGIESYHATIASAMQKYAEGKDLGELLARDENWDLLRRCLSLDVGVDVERCLAKAREILGGAGRAERDLLRA